MAGSIFPTPFKLTPEELLISSAATIIFKALTDFGRENNSISEICDHPQYGYTASAEVIANGPRFVRITDIKGGDINRDTVPYCTCDEPGNYIIKAGDILVARAGSIGKSFLVSDVPEIAVFASYMICLRTQNGTLPDYVYWFFQSQQFWLQIASFDRGSAMSNINGKMLSELILPKVSQNEQISISNFLQTFHKKLFGERIDLPELPLPMQNVRRIVSRIEALAGRLAAAQSLRREASEATSLLIHSWVSNVFDYEFGDELPKGWSWKSFSQVLVPDGMRTGPFGIALNKSEIMDDGVPVFGIANVGNNQFVHGFTDFVSFEKAEILSSYTLRAGDIAVARSGTVGRSCVVPKGLFPEPLMSSNLIRIRIDTEVFLPDLMCCILNGSKLVERHKDKECRGSSRIFFTQKILNKFQLPVPPLEEQRRLVAYLDGLQAQVSQLRLYQEETQKELNALMPSILDKAFKGEL